MSKLIAQSVFLFIFLALLIAPLTNLNLRGERARWENRFLVKTPHFLGLKAKDKELKEFVKQWEDYLQDRIGFREKMVSAFRRSSYYILRMPSGKIIIHNGEARIANGILVGREGELFQFDNYEASALIKPNTGDILNWGNDFAEVKRLAEDLAENLNVPIKAAILPHKTVLEAANLPYYIHKFMFTPPPPPTYATDKRKFIARGKKLDYLPL